MTELTQPTQRERTAPGGGGLGSLFADNHEPGGLVTVAVGPYVERLPLGNNTVAQIRARFGLRFDIDPRSQAVLDGHEVGDDTVVRTGQVLMFVHKSGEKGTSKLQIPNSKFLGSSKRQAALPRLVVPRTRRWCAYPPKRVLRAPSPGGEGWVEGGDLELAAWSFFGALSFELGVSPRAHRYG